MTHLSTVLHRARRTMLLEWYRDLRRYAGDERLPADLRIQLRERAQRLLAKASATDAVTRVPRRSLRDSAKAALRPEQPTVVFDVRRRPDTCGEAMEWLRAEGYSIIDLTGPMSLPAATFVVCDTLDAQHAAHRLGTPSLLLNARDPFSGYPVPADSLFTLATAIDLDTGDIIEPHAMLTEDFFRRVRSCGYRDNRPAEVLAAVHEMRDGLTSGWREHDSQSRFRERVVAAGGELARHVPAVAEWGPDDGFIGDGRLAAWQAERVDRERMS